MYESVKNWKSLIRVTDKLYRKVFNVEERKLYDGSSIENKLRIAKLLLEERPEDLEERLMNGRKMYKESFSRFSRFLDDNSVGNILTIVELSRKI
ncbi:MAG: hypothetical protein ACE5K0_03435 [Candidatus Methanofastidiosia archaeon]